MLKKNPRLYIGTSGWIYPHWDKVFYPKKLNPKNKLRYFSQYFKTVEVNYSFYHLPKITTYRNWYSQTLKDFLFSVKVSRFITHIKRLKGTKTAWRRFIKNALTLKEKLGPFLFQFPPSFKAVPENIKKLEDFLKLICKSSSEYPFKTPTLRFAFEFRHQSWCRKEIYKILKKYNIAWVIADSPRYPKSEQVTADFVYIRLHGSQILFSSKYTEKELKNLAGKIKKWLKQKKDVFVYFNNDVQGFAVENAKELMALLDKFYK